MEPFKYKQLILSVLGLFILAPISFDIGPLPITLQSFVIIVMAGLFSRKASLIAILLYLVAGALGLPIFGAYTGGWEKLIGPTAGFLWGFILVVLFVAYEARQKEMHLFNAMVLGLKAHFLLLIPGFLVLYFSIEGIDLWSTFTRLIPGLLIKSIVGGILISQTRSFFYAID
jgi:biotin transport system substrate-specific component